MAPPHLSAAGTTTVPIPVSRPNPGFGSAVLLLIIIATSGCEHSPTQLEEPPPLVRTDTTWVDLDLSATHACGLTASGRAACWGNNAWAQLGVPKSGPEICPTAGTTVGCSRRPVILPDAPRLTSLATGGEYSCGVDDSGAVWCWGGADPVPVSLASPGPVVQLSANDDFPLRLCGVHPDGAISCWEDGPFWYRPFADSDPASIVGPEPFASVSVGGRHVCGIGVSGAAYCWGENDAGQLGAGDFRAREAPTPVSGGLRFTDLTVGRAHTCGVERSGKIYCWGENRSAQLGALTPKTCYVDIYYPNYCPSPVPIQVVASRATFRSVAAGSEHTCGLDMEGRVACWGASAGGALGADQTNERCASGKGNASGDPCSTSPVLVETSTRFVRVEAGRAFTCGISDRGAALCWGSNLLAKLGAPELPVNLDATSSGSIHPVEVANPVVIER